MSQQKGGAGYMNLLFPIYPIVKKYKNLLYMRMKLCFNNVILMHRKERFL